MICELTNKMNRFLCWCFTDPKPKAKEEVAFGEFLLYFSGTVLCICFIWIILPIRTFVCVFNPIFKKKFYCKLKKE